MGRVGLWRALALGGAAVVVAGGCSAVPSATLDRASVQHTIATWLAERYDLPEPAVSCPAGVPGRAGTRFHCTTTVAGTEVTVTGTVAAAPGHFDISLDRAIISAAAASRVLASGLRQPGAARPEVNCGPRRVEVVAPGGTFTCTATADGVTTRVTGTASDLRGDVRFLVGSPQPVVRDPDPPEAPTTVPAQATPPTTTDTRPTTTTTTPTTTTPTTTPATTPTTTAPTTTTPTTTPPATTPPTTAPTTTPTTASPAAASGVADPTSPAPDLPPASPLGSSPSVGTVPPADDGGTSSPSSG